MTNGPAPPPPPLNPHAFCATCYFATTRPDGIMLCCFNPPSWQRSNVTYGAPPPPTGSQSHALLMNWPIVRPTDWCGHGFDTVSGNWNTPDGKQLTS